MRLQEIQGLCYWCGVNRSEGVDHLVPRSRGGSDDAANLVLCCKSCNSRKGPKTADEYRSWLAEQA
jgi:5-methylcytosine-specific restriction endonuclease McrA